MAGDTVVPPPQRGASRVLDLRWPDAGQTSTVGTQVLTARPGVAGTVASGGMTTVGQGGATDTPTYVKGQACARFPSAVGPTGCAKAFGGFADWPHERTSNGDLPTDYRCWSFRATMCYDNMAAPLSALRDAYMGLRPNGANLQQNSVGGMGIQFGALSNTDVRLRARRVNAGAFTIDEALTALVRPDPREWAEYELRVIGALRGADASLQGFINGIPVTQKYAFAAASALLPNSGSNAPNYGWQFYVLNFTVGELANLNVKEMRMIAAPNEGALP